MIRLTVGVQSEPEVYLFDKSTLLLGKDPAQVDLSFPELDIDNTHLKIIQQNGSYILINLHDDPFVFVNGSTFGKKLLNDGDIILVHNIEILFETVKGKIENESPANKATHSNGINDSLFHYSLPFEDELETLKKDEWATVPSSEDQSLKKKRKNEATDLLAGQQGSLKDDYLRDMEDGQPGSADSNESNHLYQAWKRVLIFIFSLLSIASIVGTIIYFSLSDKTEAQETKVAQAVADISIALTHAQLNHLKPSNQNWSDIEFLKTNLQVILPGLSSYATDIDAQGQFYRFPYSLRIYTSSDLSKFLLIAQPAPSLLQWIIPKSVILVDSNVMELRAIKDVRSLNRLLANADPLDGVNGKEISALIKQGELIRLNSLTSHSSNLDFSPPKSLAWLKPGSENLIYNAPRYHRLGKSLIQKAIVLSTTKGSSQEVASFKKDIESFTRLNDWLLYTEDGKHSAIQMKQGLTTFAPSEKMLFGYLSLNTDGKIQLAAILDDEVSSEPIVPLNEKEAIAALFPEENNHSQNVIENMKVDINHPVYVQLSSLQNAREADLKPIAKAIKNLIDEETEIASPNFQSRFHELSFKYLKMDSKYLIQIKETLKALYEQYEELSTDQFLTFAQATNCDNLITSNNEAVVFNNEQCFEHIENILNQVEEAKSFSELSHLIHSANAFLTLDHFQNMEDLVKYQNLLRNAVLKQIEEVLFSNKGGAYKLWSSNDKEAFHKILSYERVIRPEEQEVFKEEFENLFPSL